MFADDPALVQQQREQDESLDHDSPLEEVFEDQLACADMVVAVNLIFWKRVMPRLLLPKFAKKRASR